MGSIPTLAGFPCEVAQWESTGRVWPHRLMARTQVFHTCNRSSILRGATLWQDDLETTTGSSYDIFYLREGPITLGFATFCQSGWNGRRGALKTHCPKGRAGSNPVSGTCA